MSREAVGEEAKEREKKKQFSDQLGSATNLEFQILKSALSSNLRQWYSNHFMLMSIQVYKLVNLIVKIAT